MTKKEFEKKVIDEEGLVAKTILEGMSKCCAECNYLYEYSTHTGYGCSLSQDYIDYNFDIVNERHKRCPLVEIKEKR